MTRALPRPVTRRPPPGAPVLPRLVRSRFLRWLGSGTRLAQAVLTLLALSIFVGFFALAFLLGSVWFSFFVAGLVWLGAGLLLRRSPARHYLAFRWRLRTRRAYRNAGLPSADAAALLWASGVDPADVRALLAQGWTPGDLASVGFVLADHHERNERLAIDLLAAAPPEHRERTVQLLGRVLDLPAAPEEAVGYWLKGCHPSDAVLLLGASVPLSLYRAAADVPAFQSSPVDWLAGLWPPLAEKHCPPELLLTWATERPGFVTGGSSSSFARQMGGMIADWIPVGPDAPWWHDAGFTPAEATTRLAAANPPTRANLAAFAALRAPSLAPDTCIRCGGPVRQTGTSGRFCPTCGLYS